MNKPFLWVVCVMIVLVMTQTSTYADIYTAKPIAMYGSETFTTPFYRIYNGTLSPQKSALDVGSNARWIMSSSSMNRTETLLVTLNNPPGNSDTVSFQVWNETTWSKLVHIGSDTDVSYKGIDVKYFADARSAIIVYTDNDQSTPFSRIWNGTAIGAEITALDVGATVQVVTLATHPQITEALLLTEDTQNDINFQVWNGTSWIYQTELETNSWGNYEPMGIAYELLTNRSLLMWADRGLRTPSYRIWNRTNLSIEYEAPDIGANPRFFAMASKPRSDEIAVAIVDDASDTNLIVWNGTNWSTPFEAATSGRANRKAADIAYEQVSRRAIVAYDDGSDIVKYRIWNGSAWSSQFSLGDMGNEMTWIKLAPDPRSDNISAIIQDDNGDITLFVWNGTNWTSLGEVLSNDATDSARQMSLEYEFSIDKSPNVTLISPPNLNSSVNRNLTFIADLADDISLKNATLYINSTGTLLPNQSVDLTGLSNTTSFTLNNLAVNATYLWNILVCDSSSQCSFATSNFTVTVQDIPQVQIDHSPNVTLISPPNLNSSVNRNLTFIADLADDIQLKNATLYVNTTGSFTANQTAIVSSANATVIFTLNNLAESAYLWNILACDSSDQCSFALSNFTVTISAQGNNQSVPLPSSPSSSPPSAEQPYSPRDSGFDRAALASQAQSNKQPSTSAPESTKSLSSEGSPASESPGSQPQNPQGNKLTGMSALTGSSVKDTGMLKGKTSIGLLLLFILLIVILYNLLKNKQKTRTNKGVIEKLKEKVAKTPIRSEEALKSQWNVKHDDYKEKIQAKQKKQPLTLYDIWEHFPESYKELRSKGIIALPKRKPLPTTIQRYLQPSDLKAMFPESLKDVKENTLKPFNQPERKYPIQQRSIRTLEGEEQAFKYVLKEKQEVEEKPKLEPVRKINKDDNAKKEMIQRLKGVYKIG